MITKKCYLGIVIFFLALSLSSSVLASESQSFATEVSITESFDNGYYLKTTLQINGLVISPSIQSGSKTVEYIDASGNTLWYVTVSGTFSYQKGESCTCTSVSGNSASYNSTWKVSSATTSKKNNTASATATGKHYLAGSLIETIDRTVTLTCDTYGNLY